MEFLKVQDIYKEQAGSPTLHPVSFSVSKGKKIGIAGATGSGKSTLLKIIAGLVQPQGGNVFLEGKRVLGPDEKLLPGHPAIGYLSQHFELRNNYTIGEELDYANILPSEEAHAIYEICDIAHLLSRETNEVSGGEKQRVVTARVLTTQPQLLLLDEPFSNLDMGHRKTMKSIIRHISESLGVTCMLVAHDPADTLSWADEIMVLEAGSLVQRGTPKEIYDNPVNEYVAGLFGNYTLLSSHHAALFGIAAPNEHQQLLVRPEKIAVDTSLDGALQGTVVDRMFLGSHIELTLSISDFLITAISLNHQIEVGAVVSVSLQMENACWIG